MRVFKSRIPSVIEWTAVAVGMILTLHAGLKSLHATEPPPPQSSYEDIGDSWQGDIGDVIDPYTGDLAYPVSDISLPARGELPLDFTRTYTSGFYKPKFASTYDCRVGTSDTNDVRSLFLGVGWLMPIAKILGDTIVWPGGGSETMFYDNSIWGKSHNRLKTKSFTIYTNHYNTTDDADTIWTDTLLFLNGNKWFFSKKWSSGVDSVFHGKYLRRMADPYGNYVDYVYYKTSPMLKEIRESTGRKIWFTYNNMADTTNPKDTTLLVKTSWRNTNGDTSSVQYFYSNSCHGYTGSVCKKYLRKVTYPSGDSVNYTYTDTIVSKQNYEYPSPYSCSEFDTLMPNFRLLSTVQFTGGDKVQYQYGEGLRQYCYESGYGMQRISVHRRIRNDLDTTEFRHMSPLLAHDPIGQEIYIWDNHAGDSVQYQYHFYDCSGGPETCDDYGFTSAGIYSIKRFDLRGQTCGSRTTPIWERYFKWCDTKIGYDSLVSPFTPVWIPHPKTVITIQCGDTTSVVRTSMDTCTGEILGSFQLLSMNASNEWIDDTVTTRSFDDEKWTWMVVDRRVVEKTLHGQDTSFAHLYWDGTKVRVKGRRVGIGADTLLAERLDLDTYGNVTKVTDANGNARETIYDATGTFPVSSKNDENGFSYSVSSYSSYTGAVLRVVDTVEAETTACIYDSADRLIRTRRPLDNDSSMVRRYYAAMRIVRDSVKIRPGVFITSESMNDVSGRSSESKIIGATATVLSRTFRDPTNREVRSVRARYSTDTDSSVTKSYTDALGRLRKTIAPNGDIDSAQYAYRTAIDYNAAGQAVRKTNVDGFGRLRMSMTNTSYSDTVFYRHGPFGRLQSTVNPMHDSIYTRFDAFNRADTSREANHDAVKIIYYDRVGNPRIVKNPMGTWLYYKYDKLNRVREFGIADASLSPDSAISQTYPTSGVTVLVKYRYDNYGGFATSDSASYAKPHGYLTRRWEKVGSDSNYTLFYYDKRGRLAQEAIKLSGLSVKKVKHTFNLDDNPATMKYPNDSTIAFNYDDLGRLIEIPSFVDSGSAPGFKYEPWGALKEIRYVPYGGNWLQTKFVYDKLSRDTLEYTVNHTDEWGPVRWWGARYAYNNLGQLTTIHDVDTSGIPKMKAGEFKYTYLGQVDTSFSRSVIDSSQSKTQRWWYDKDGKWDSTRVAGTTTKFTYDSGNRARLVSKTVGLAETDYTFDAWGNMTYDESKGDTYDYDYSTNTLRRILPNGTGTHKDSLTFVYDALGRKVIETYRYWYQDSCGTPEFGSGGGETEGSGEGGGETDAGGGGLCWYQASTTMYYIWQGHQVIAEYNEDGSLRNNFLYANGKQLARFTDTAATHIGYVISDHQGSLRSYSQKGEAEMPTSRWRAVDYRPFGEILKQQNTGSVARDNYLYTGKEWKDVAGVDLTYYGARWYDATVGRFMQTDPAGEGTNAYSLAMNNPVTGVDPWGLQTRNYYRFIRRWKTWERFEKWFNSYLKQLNTPVDHMPGTIPRRPSPQDGLEPDAGLIASQIGAVIISTMGGFEMIPAEQLIRRNGQLGYSGITKIYNDNAGVYPWPDGLGVTVISDFYYQETWNAAQPGDMIFAAPGGSNSDFLSMAGDFAALEPRDEKPYIYMGDDQVAGSTLQIGYGQEGLTTIGPAYSNAEESIGKIAGVFRPRAYAGSYLSNAREIIRRHPGFDLNLETWSELLVKGHTHIPIDLDGGSNMSGWEFIRNVYQFPPCWPNCDVLLSH